MRLRASPQFLRPEAPTAQLGYYSARQVKPRSLMITLLDLNLDANILLHSVGYLSAEVEGKLKALEGKADDMGWRTLIDA
jgi:hypothetical protein